MNPEGEQQRLALRQYRPRKATAAKYKAAIDDLIGHPGQYLPQEFAAKHRISAMLPYALVKLGMARQQNDFLFANVHAVTEQDALAVAELMAKDIEVTPEQQQRRYRLMIDTPYTKDDLKK